MAHLTNDEIKTTNQIRIRENNREKAEQYSAQIQADRANGWTAFVTQHSGAVGVHSGNVFFDCDANRQLLEEWIDQQGFLVNSGALEIAFDSCRERLAQPPVQPYVRRIDLNKSHFMPQLRSYAPAELTLPFTRDQILSWSKERLRWESRTPERIKALNKILAGQENWQ